ncbi:DUF2157 domain-containing protein [Bdellovibrio sp. HCB209]|uniref:DUF2157 domain-containing protein n=1 Tax=Bdellovibrio sp. HCB209 TaxID=3394354 RepID=UPI0039B554AC
MSRLNKKLEHWKQLGLISPTQYDAIVGYEDSLPSTNWTMIGITILAVATISLGLISLIAYNWHLIPAPVKLASGFATLCSTGYAIFHFKDRQSPLVKDGLIAFFILFCFVMIGLIAQIYNLSGPVYQTGLFWCAITLLITSFASHTFVRAFWVFMFLLSLVTACFEMPFIKSHYVSPFTLFTLGAALIAFISRMAFKNHPMQRTLEGGVIASWILGCLLYSFHFYYHDVDPDSFAKIIPQLAMAPLILALVGFDSTLKKSHKVLLSILVCLTTFNAYLESFSPRLNVLPALLGVIGFAAFGLLFYSTGHRKLFNFMFALVGIKVFEIFIRNTSGLLATGLGLVLAGVITLLAVYGWNSNKSRIEARLQELLK